MKLQEKEFDGSSSMFKTHQLLQSTAGTSTWVTEFRPISHEHLNFVELLLRTFCMLGICCALSGTFPAFIAGMFNSYFVVTLCIAINSSTILDPLLGRNGYQRQTFPIGPFKFTLSANRE